MSEDDPELEAMARTVSAAMRRGSGLSPAEQVAQAERAARGETAEPRSRAVPKAELEPRFGDQAERCRRSRCIACLHLRMRETTRVIPHHLRTIGAGGRDRDTVPLCLDHHEQIHTRGRFSFWARLGIPMRVVADALTCLRRGGVWDEWQVVPY